jgi:hypothetical protein
MMEGNSQAMIYKAKIGAFDTLAISTNGQRLLVAGGES